MTGHATMVTSPHGVYRISPHGVRLVQDRIELPPGVGTIVYLYVGVVSSPNGWYPDGWSLEHFGVEPEFYPDRMDMITYRNLFTDTIYQSSGSGRMVNIEVETILFRIHAWIEELGVPVYTDYGYTHQNYDLSRVQGGYPPTGPLMQWPSWPNSPLAPPGQDTVGFRIIDIPGSTPSLAGMQSTIASYIQPDEHMDSKLLWVDTSLPSEGYARWFAEDIGSTMLWPIVAFYDWLKNWARQGPRYSIHTAQLYPDKPWYRLPRAPGDLDAFNFFVTRYATNLLFRPYSAMRRFKQYVETFL